MLFKSDHKCYHFNLDQVYIHVYTCIHMNIVPAHCISMDCSRIFLEFMLHTCTYMCIHVQQMYHTIVEVQCSPQDCRKAQGLISIHTNYVIVLSACSICTTRTRNHAFMRTPQRSSQLYSASENTACVRSTVSQNALEIYSARGKLR